MDSLNSESLHQDDLNQRWLSLQQQQDVQSLPPLIKPQLFARKEHESADRGQVKGKSRALREKQLKGRAKVPKENDQDQIQQQQQVKEVSLQLQLRLLGQVKELQHFEAKLLNRNKFKTSKRIRVWLNKKVGTFEGRVGVARGVMREQVLYASRITRVQ